MFVNLKGRINELTDLIDAAHERKIEAKMAVEKEIAEVENFEGQVKSTERRIQLLEKEAKEVEERLVLKDAQLKETEQSIESIEKDREKLEDEESESDEKLITLEEQLKAVKREMERNITKLRETGMKKIVTEQDLKKMREKAEILEQREEILIASVEKAVATLEELEDREGESADREDVNLQKIEFLLSQVAEIEVRAEAAERQCGVLDRTNLELCNEVEGWKKRREHMEKEMSAMDDVSKIEKELVEELQIDIEMITD